MLMKSIDFVFILWQIILMPQQQLLIWLNLFTSVTLCIF